MTVDPLPNRIELTDLSGGFAPDPPEASLPLNTSPDVLNLLPDPGSGTPEIRKGFERLYRFTFSGSEDYYVRHLNYFEVIDNSHRHRYLIAILSTGVDSVANNIQIWMYDLKNDVAHRIDTPGRAWSKPNHEHWFAIVGGVYYGGTRSEPIYSYDPEFTGGDWDAGASIWDADAAAPNSKTWKDDIDASINTDSEVGRDYAFKARTNVSYSGKFYTAASGIRYNAWEDGQHYSTGAKVSRQAAWGQSGSDSYWKSFRCIKGHKADGGSFKPGDGSAGDDEHWEKIRLSNPLDDDGDITEDWFYNPAAPRGRVGIWHGRRLWIRRDDEDNHSRIQYTAPALPERNQEIADLNFDPTDWAAVDDIDGDGGGWLDFPAMQDGDSIRFLQSFGNYLIVAKRWESYVLSGLNEATWTVRRLGDFGALAPGAGCEHEGLVYMLSPSGTLVVTDGTSMQEVPGAEHVRDWLKDRIDRILLGVDDFNWQPSVVSYGRFVWITLPDPDPDTALPTRTIVYDPRTASFWATDLPALDLTVGANRRAFRMYMSTTYYADGSGTPGIYQYQDDPGNERYKDDGFDGPGSDPEDPIVWRIRTAWLQFGGGLRYERRIRRVYALAAVENGEAISVGAFRNYDSSSVDYQVSRTSTGREAYLFEGKVMPVSYAVAMKAGGTTNKYAAITGFGLDTEPIRIRYNRGVGS